MELPRLMVPSAFRVTVGVRLTKSAAHRSHTALTLAPFSPAVIAGDVCAGGMVAVGPWKERLLVKTCVPLSNLMFSSPLSHEVLLANVMLPRLRLKEGRPCFLLPRAIERRTV